ncbi:hypothetical protein ACIBSW_34530 [Actinoplanes sp. NPDC049668]|uniref:hypothetical protein n=1 Tax=unclassified Actinoplanes TaxID=2626549 RepID=UPI0033AFD5E0
MAEMGTLDLREGDSDQDLELEQDAEEQGDEEELDPERLPGLKSALREERKRARAYRSELTKLGYVVGKDGALQAPQRKAPDEDPEQLLQAAKDEANAEWGRYLVAVEARSELSNAGFLGDPESGVRMLDLDEIQVSNRSVDRAAVRDAIEELKEKSPRLFKRSRSRDDSDEEEEEQLNGRARRHVGSADQGRRLPNVTQKSPAEIFGSFRRNNGLD